MNCAPFLRFLALMTTCLQKPKHPRISYISRQQLSSNGSNYQKFSNRQAPASSSVQIAQIGRVGDQIGTELEGGEGKGESTHPSLTVLGSEEGEADGGERMSLETK
jgi:hypothetical protein